MAAQASESGIDYKVILAIIYVAAFVVDVGLVLWLLFQAPHVYAPPISSATPVPIPSPTPTPTPGPRATLPPLPEQLYPNNAGAFLGKLIGIFSAPIGVIFGGIFGTATGVQNPVDRGLKMLLYVLSIAWALLMIAATLISLLTPTNVLDVVGAGAAVLTTAPLAYVFTRSSSSSRSAGPPRMSA